MANFTVEITDLARGGKGVGRLPDNRVVFVPFTMPGDKVEIEIASEEKRYVFGNLVKVLAASPKRVLPKCKVFSQCGGCEWQHIPYDLQWQTKVNGLKHALRRVNILAEFVWEEFSAEIIYEYRNRVQLRGLADKIGFYAKGSKTIVPIERCEIARAEINRVLPEVLLKGKSFKREYKVELFVDAQEVIHQAWNSKHGALGFEQVHEKQNLKLRAWVEKHASPNDIIWDLFGGRGNLSLALTNVAKEIHCVDVGAYDNTPENLPKNFHSYRGPVLQWLRNQDNSGSPDLVILDPPREGLGHDGAEIFDRLLKAKAKKILLIGCDADAWAHDLSRAGRHGWKLGSVGALDLFPQTHHVEALAALIQK